MKELNIALAFCGFLDRHPHGGLMTPQNVGVDFFQFVLKSE